MNKWGKWSTLGSVKKKSDVTSEIRGFFFFSLMKLDPTVSLSFPQFISLK